jgi:ABC-type Na+ transport system ATPase subunit NatA
LTAHLKVLEQKEAIIPKRIRQQEIIIFRAEINQIETKRTIQRINKTRSSLFEKINKIDKSLTGLMRGHRTVSKFKKSETQRET